MPIYEFTCNRCGAAFEKILFQADEEKTITCPKCAQPDVRKLVSSCTHTSSSGPTAAPSSGCVPKGGFS